MSEDLGAYVSTPEPEPAPRRKRGATIAIAAGAAVALVAGVLAVATVNDGGGGGTPEAAVQKLFDAMVAEDALGALDALVPAERDVVSDRLAAIVDELGRLGVLDEGLDLSHIPGGDLAFDGLKLQSEALSDEVASVSVTGDRMRLAVTSADLPLGPVTRPLLDRAGPLPALEPVEPVVARLAAVRQGGTWYVSLAHSLADFLRREAGLGAPDFTAAVAPRGESSPEAAVRELARAGADLDVRRLVELAPPGEGAALHQYAPLLLPFAERWAKGAKAGGLAVSVDPLELTVDGSGDEAQVAVQNVTVTTTSGEGRQTFGYDGRCVRFDDEADDEEPSELCPDDPELAGLAGTGFGSLTVSVVRESGSWYISPVRSWLDGLLNSLRAIDRAELDTSVAEYGAWGLFPLLSPYPPAFLSLGVRVGDDEAVEVDAPSVELGQPPVTVAASIPSQPLPFATTVP